MKRIENEGQVYSQDALIRANKKLRSSENPGPERPPASPRTADRFRGKGKYYTKRKTGEKRREKEKVNNGTAKKTMFAITRGASTNFIHPEKEAGCAERGRVHCQLEIERGGQRTAL